jgi:transcriptional regulator with PAS, ATPase and Fis domain
MTTSVNAADVTLEQIVGVSRWAEGVRKLIRQIAPTPASVLIIGPSGTGKEIIARAIHALSHRSSCPFVPVDCAAITGTLFESHMFGHVRGAFTGAHHPKAGCFRAADGGTLFLDEIGEMSLDMQVKLLRVLEHGEFMRVGSSIASRVDARIIVATNKNLKEEVLSGKFREDLYFRIHIIPIHLPSLRQRRDDIPLLIEYFIDAYAKRHDTEPASLSKEDMAFFLKYSYPGNVRELQNMLERALLMGGGVAELNAAANGDLLPSSEIPEDIAGLLDSEDPLRDARADLEKDIIIKVLALHNNNHTKAAVALKISRAALYKKIKRYGVKVGQK